MKNIVKSLYSIAIIAVVFFSFSKSTYAQGNRGGGCMNTDLISDIPKSDLNDEEKAGLILMREEEKLARDVYVTLGEKWNLPMFSNIPRSEQMHTDAVKALLDRYEIEDPIKNDAAGVFTSPELLELYKTLVAKGSTSLMDALEVGATIEDLDIKDLNELLAKTDNEDITVTYDFLNMGSRNHMRAFSRQINNRGGSYTPQYISSSEYENILSSPHERGFTK
jgi:hypothetical protein